jgi:YVTN family beta-propeller protein
MAFHNRSRVFPAHLRATKIAIPLLLCLLAANCGDTYRPVAQPIPLPPPNPAAFHFVISLTTNGSVDPGAASRLDVSGDTTEGLFATGVAPTHAALIPNGTKLYVVNTGEDTVSANNTSTPTAVTTISLPSGSQPVFAHTTENGNVYVANYGNNTVSVINTTSNVVTATVPVGTHPVAMAELPNAQKLYAANQGSGTVTVINTVDDSVGTTIPVGPSPVWAVARADNAKVYVLDGSGTIYEIDTLSDAATPVSTSLGSGANFMALDPRNPRLYVTNPTNSKVGIFDVSGTLTPVSVIDLSQGATPPCPGGCSPVSVSGIGDGTRAYVASYHLAPCTTSSGNCVNTQVEVIATGSNTVSKVIPIASNVFLDPATKCGPSSGFVPWTPGMARFRLFAAASGGGSTSNFKVYVSQCDAGNVAVIDTFASSSGVSVHAADVYTASIRASLSSFPPQQLAISASAQDTTTNTTIYSYALTSGSGLQVGMSVFITGMADSGNNGSFVISGLGNGTFTVTNPLGVTAGSSNGTGTGTVMPPQNPVFLVAGP